MSNSSFKYFKKPIKISIAQIVTCLSLAYTITLSPCYAQQIITDGNTQTNLATSGNTTTVTTQTINGSNAFNSFSKFNVDSGKTVNLIVPSSTNNLINVITSGTTNINGVLNSIKDNHIGGNVFLINPHGIVIGNQGVVNVGSLTAITPTQVFTNSFFDSPGIPNNSAVVSVLNGTVPINNSASVTNNGRINAITDVKINAGPVTNTGDIYSGAVFQENNITIGDVVNINTLENGANIVNQGGTVTINANSCSNVVLSGLILNPNGNVTITNTGGSILDGTPGSEDANIIAKNITLTAGGTIGTSIDDLNIDTGSSSTSLLTATTSNQLINIKEMNGDLYVNSINSGTGDVILISAGSILDSNPSTPEVANIIGNNITLTAVGTIGTLLDDININTGSTTSGVLTANTTNQFISIKEISGDLYVKSVNAGMGDVILKSANNLFIVLSAKVDSSANVQLNAGNSAIIGNDSIINAGNDLSIISSNDIAILGNAEVNVLDNITLTSINSNASISENAKVSAGNNINLTAKTNSFFYGNAQINASGNINLRAGKDAYITGTIVNAGKSITLAGNSAAYINNLGQITAANDIYLTGTNTTFINSAIVNAKGTISLTGFGQAFINGDSTITAELPAFN